MVYKPLTEHQIVEDRRTIAYLEACCGYVNALVSDGHEPEEIAEQLNLCIRSAHIKMKSATAFFKNAEIYFPSSLAGKGQSYPAVVPIQKNVFSCFCSWLKTVFQR